MTISHGLAAAMLAGLAACSNGGSDNSGNGGNGSGPRSFAEIEEDGQTLFEVYEAVELTAVEDVPSSGSATFDGVALYSSAPSVLDAIVDDPEGTIETIVADPDAVSELTMNVDFGDDTLSGRAYDFRSENGVDVDGDLEITDGVIDGNEFMAEIGGTLTEGGDEVDYDGDIAGGFVGDDAEALAGAAVATGTSGDEVFGVVGVIAAQR